MRSIHVVPVHPSAGHVQTGHQAKISEWGMSDDFFFSSSFFFLGLSEDAVARKAMEDDRQT
jgi:hypothetical protein